MKTTILGLAFLTIASFSFSASAQQKTQSNENCKSRTECVAKDKKCCKDGKKFRAHKKADLFEGITLTSEQQGRIEALNNASKVSREEIKAKAKTAREQKDTTYNPRNARKELRSKYINDLGEILTSDQMVVYLKNFYVNSGSHHGGKKAVAMKQGKGNKDVRFNKDSKGNHQGKALRQMQSASK